MQPGTHHSLIEPFCPKAVDEQVSRILREPVFENSPILRNILRYVVGQTLAGHKEWIKEYTIAVHALHKPADFNPKVNGIVRIHAARLRQALQVYYASAGVADPIIIQIPKGRYIPAFTVNHGLAQPAGSLLTPIVDNEGTKPGLIAVMPFECSYTAVTQHGLADGLGMQLSSALMQVQNHAVVAYYTTRDALKKTNDVLAAARLVCARYVVTGTIQAQNNTLRVHVQLSDACNGQQLLSCMYEDAGSPNSCFSQQDDIVDFILNELNRCGKFTVGKKLARPRFVAVA